jgi:hypothetical protein
MDIALTINIVVPQLATGTVSGARTDGQADADAGEDGDGLEAVLTDGEEEEGPAAASAEPAGGADADGLGPNKRQKVSRAAAGAAGAGGGETERDPPPAAARGRITRFAQPRHRMFETRDTFIPHSDYGRSIEGFHFQNISTSSFRCALPLSLPSPQPIPYTTIIYMTAIIMSQV